MESWGTYLRQDGSPVTLWRKGQRCQFRDEDGQAVGPEHRNVYSALVWMYAETEWFDQQDVMGTIRCRAEVRRKVTYR